jgi:hypothetical protein
MKELYIKERYTKNQRLSFIMEMITSLRNFRGENGNTVNLYNEEYDAIKTLKQAFDGYLNQNDATSVTYEGTIIFDELNRKLQYKLPAFSPHKPMLLLMKPN